MTVEEWKKKLVELCGEITEKYKDMFDHINVMYDIPEEFDTDEVCAFMLIKLKKMEKDIASMSN